MSSNEIPLAPAPGPDDVPSNFHLARVFLTDVALLLGGVLCLSLGNIVLGVILCILAVAMFGVLFAIAKLCGDVVAKRHANVFRLIAQYLQPDVPHRSSDSPKGLGGEADDEERRIDEAVGFGLTRAASRGGFFSGGMSEDNLEKLRGNVLNERSATYAWLQESPQWEAVAIESFDGTALEARAMVSNPHSDRWVVLCHGYAGTWGSMIQYARHWAQEGYNLLLPSMRGHEESAGERIGMGFLDRLDVVAWCKALVAGLPVGPKGNNIVLMGHSMGATAVNMANAEDGLPEEVRAVVSDCGFCSVWRAFSSMAQSAGIPVHPTVDLVRVYLSVGNGGYDIAKGDVAKALEKAKVPTFFVHGTGDETVPPYMLGILESACATSDGYLLVDAAGHCQSSLMEPELYWNAVLGFAESHIR